MTEICSLSVIGKFLCLPATGFKIIQITMAFLHITPTLACSFVFCPVCLGLCGSETPLGFTHARQMLCHGAVFLALMVH